MRKLATENAVLFSLTGLIFLWGSDYAQGEFCRWVDEQGVTHYARECPEREGVELIETQPALTEAQQKAAQKRSAELLQGSREFSPSRSPSLRRFRSLPEERLGPLPDNTVSRYLRTSGTGISFNKENAGRFTLFIETLESLPRGSYLDVHFPDPSNPADKNIVGKVVQEEKSKMLFESPASNRFKCWNYEVLVKVYTDNTKLELLDTHSQFIQSRYDNEFFDDQSSFLLQMMDGSKCPPDRDKKMSRMSAEQLEALCEQEREKRLKPERERLIKNCIEKMDRSKEYCTNFYADYGDAARIDRFHVRPALYYDLPECVAAQKARIAEK